VGEANSVGWDADAMAQFIAITRPIAKVWFRPEVRGLDTFPSDGALVVSNHSGGVLTTDTLIFSMAFYDRFGFDRPVHTLGHSALFVGPIGDLLRKTGLIHADPDTATAALRDGAVVMVFPGGLYDAFRPTAKRNTIDFNGRTGYVKAALAAGVPIVPVVSIGGQENQLFLTRGTWLARRLGLNRMRSDILPITVGFPFGVSAVVPFNIPLPTKIVTQVLEPIDVTGQFGTDSDVKAVDAHVRTRMQQAMDSLARERRFPVFG
jgi:1-acyl-sn-glycerol-3-phosphate acyltransferase